MIKETREHKDRDTVDTITYEYNEDWKLIKTYLTTKTIKKYLQSSYEYSNEGTVETRTDYSETGEITDKTVTEYDDRGNKISSKKYTKENSLTQEIYYTYDVFEKEVDGKVEQIYVLSRLEYVYGTEKFISKYIIDEKNMRIAISRDIFGCPDAEYIYNSSGQLVKTEIWDLRGKTSKFNQYHYDSQGNQTEMLYYKEEGDLRYIIKYEYQKKE
ncbi:MAG: hypothetical protein JW904_02020 [Spirochaetales bacterium]|nr:hypothetical protein [Spirochaetales bacterium]